MLAVMLLIVGSVFTYHVYKEVELRTDMVHDQLNTINGRILDAYEKNVDIHQYLQFLERFYDNSMFDELRLSVYSHDGRPLYNLGELIPLDVKQEDYVSDESREGETGKTKLGQVDDSPMFYVSEVQSNDGLITVITAMPLTLTIADAVAINTDIWFLLAGLLAVSTVIIFYSTRFLSRNILMMRNFARQASKGESIDVNYDFPHDELGDISREIVSLYSDKAKALARSQHEHQVALNAVNEKSRIKREMTNNINHELKTPIGVIRGYVDTILSDPGMDRGMMTHFLERTRSNVERLCSLMDDVSTITRLDEATSSIPLGEVDFHDMVFGIDSDFDPSQIAPGMTFEYKVPLGCRVQANENLLQGLVMNLIRNAGMHSHGKKIRLEIISESAHFYTFAFYDDGRGVPEESIPHLFDRFYRVDSGRSRKVGGTGLGLPIVKSAIVSMGGTVSVHNRSEGGLEFVFTLVKWSARDMDKKRTHTPQTGSSMLPSKE